MMVSLAVILLTPFARLGTWQFAVDVRPFYGQQFEAVADALAFGCLLAGLYNTLGTLSAYQRLLKSKWFWAAPTVLVALAFLDKPRISLFLGQSVMNVCIVLIIERMVRYPETPAGWLLNLPPLRFVGVLSYSLYLWQQLFLNRQSYT